MVTTEPEINVTMISDGNNFDPALSDLAVQVCVHSLVIIGWGQNNCKDILNPFPAANTSAICSRRFKNIVNDNVYSYNSCGVMSIEAAIAQSVKKGAVNPEYVNSSPNSAFHSYRKLSKPIVTSFSCLPPIGSIVYF